MTMKTPFMASLLTSIFSNARKRLKSPNGFSLGHGTIVSEISEVPLTEKQLQDQAIQNAIRLNVQDALEQAGHKPPPSSDKEDFLARRFNYERLAVFPWLDKEQHPVGSRSDLRQVTPDRQYSEHAIDRSAPLSEGGRGIPTRVIEHAIAYGTRKEYDSGHNRVYEGVIVGVTEDEKVVRTVIYKRGSP